MVSLSGLPRLSLPREEIVEVSHSHLEAGRCSQESASWNIFATLCIGLVLAEGCSVGPKYVKPVAQIPASYKEMGNWKTAEPSDAARKDKWWEVFRDPELNALEDKLTVSNQTLRAAQDRFLEARAALKFSRAGEISANHRGRPRFRQRSSSNRPLTRPDLPE